MVTLVTKLPGTRGDIYRPTTHTAYISKSLVHYMYTQRVCITSGIAMGGKGLRSRSLFGLINQQFILIVTHRRKMSSFS